MRGTDAAGGGTLQFDRATAASKAAPCEEAFAAAWAEGRAVSFEQAIEYVLGDA